MALPVLVNLDMGQNQILNFVVQGVTSDPTPGKVGQIIYRTDTNVLKVCTNATGPVWTILGTGSGTVTSASVASANGFTGSVATSTTTPAITIATSVTGILKGNGTAVSAATSGTDFAPATTGTSILKASSGGFANATSGTDYAPATSGSSLLKANGSGGFSNATGTDIPNITESQVTSLTTDLSAKAPLASPTFTGSPVAPTPTAGDSTTLLATTAFVTSAVSAAVQGLQVKTSARAATTGAETYTITSGSVVTIAGTSVDGVSPSIGDLVLVKDSPASSGVGSAGSSTNPNGLYQVTANTTNLTVTRAADMSGTVDLPAGAFVFVQGGTANASSGWVVSTPSVNTGFTYGSNAIQWTQFSGAGEITAGSGLTKTGNSLAVNNPLNQNTTGTAGNVTGTVAVANGGTGQTTVQAAIDALAGAVTSGQFLRGSGSHVVMSALLTADVPTNAAVAPASPGTNTKFGLVYNSGLIATSSTVLTVTHSLNNSAPGVTVWNSSGAVVLCDVAKVDANNITLTFATAPTTNTIQCTVVG